MKRFFVFLLIFVFGLSGGVSLHYAHDHVFATPLAQISTVDSEFHPELINSSTVAQRNSLTFLFVGDLMLSRGVAYQIKKHGNDFTYPFEKIADTLRAADFTFGNLEGPISAHGANQGSIYSFRADPRVIEGLVFAGFDALSIANNHIFDYGATAVADTIDLLRKNNIRPVGAGMNYDDANAARIVTVGNTTIALFAYTDLYPKSFEARAPVGDFLLFDGRQIEENESVQENRIGISEFNPQKIRDRIRAIRANADLVVVSLHWGEEYASHPSEYQKAIAHALIDAGADLVIGHHPHVVQDVEQYKNGWIFYSLGNFIFDQNFSEQTRNGLMAKVTIREKKVSEVSEISIHINDTFQPELIAP